ncbi:MAG: hypothetical protein K2M93_01265 [Muribaculaceae bacterium]|nr:hypothetical protein [Muribaculaceae bacterium]
MKRLSGIFMMVITLLCVVVSSCEKKKVNTLREPARELYLKSVALSTKYIDSISHAKDSTILLALFDRYDNDITNLNYSYPAGADYELAEGENDTLKNLSTRIIHLRDSLLYAYAHPLPADTTTTNNPDTIPK